MANVDKKEGSLDVLSYLCIVSMVVGIPANFLWPYDLNLQWDYMMGHHVILGIPGAVAKKALYDQWMILWGVLWIGLAAFGIWAFKIRKLL